MQSPSATGLTWCNDTPHRIMAAVATDDGKAVTSRGWYRIDPGKCLHPDVTGQPKQVLPRPRRPQLRRELRCRPRQLQAEHEPRGDHAGYPSITHHSPPGTNGGGGARPVQSSYTWSIL